MMSNSLYENEPAPSEPFPSFDEVFWNSAPFPSSNESVQYTPGSDVILEDVNSSEIFLNLNDYSDGTLFQTVGEVNINGNTSASESGSNEVLMHLPISCVGDNFLNILPLENIDEKTILLWNPGNINFLSVENNVTKETVSLLDNERFNSVAVESSYRELDSSHFNGVAVESSSYNEELIEVNNVQQPVISTVPHVPSSLPASQNWPGDYDFNVSFSPQEKNTKGVSWTYSKRLDKLYVGKDAPCPINFSTNSVMPENVKIRAMALYSSPESASEIVIRCVNHSLEEKSKNIFEAEHLVRCESSTATYEVDASTKRHSVVVPFENPPAGQHFSTYIYKFTCFGSCPFGPNRRPLMLVFSLERGNQVIGRRKVDVKICACPGRDRKTDEQQSALPESGGTSKKRKETEYISLSETLDFTKDVVIPLPKKAKIAPSQGQDGLYQINVDDYKCYEFLKQMKKLYEICKTVRNLPPDVKKVIAQYNQRKALSAQDV